MNPQVRTALAIGLPIVAVGFVLFQLGVFGGSDTAPTPDEGTATTQSTLNVVKINSVFNTEEFDIDDLYARINVVTFTYNQQNLENPMRPRVGRAVIRPPGEGEGEGEGEGLSPTIRAAQLRITAVMYPSPGSAFTPTMFISVPDPEQPGSEITFHVSEGQELVFPGEEHLNSGITLQSILKNDEVYEIILLLREGDQDPFPYPLEYRVASDTAN